MSCFKLQAANESVENIMFTLGNESVTHFENLNSHLRDAQPFTSNLRRCKLLEEKILELKTIIRACGSTLCPSPGRGPRGDLLSFWTCRLRCGPARRGAAPFEE